MQIYNIARILLQESKTNQTDPLPVVLTLTSWAKKQYPSLEEWIVEALKDAYTIPRAMGHSWLLSNKLRLFLDGLDEMTGEAQAACIHTINTYINDDSRKVLIHIVISARQKEFERQKINLNINDRLIILPLKVPQIRQYLRAKNLLHVLQAMDNNAQLQDILSIPLILGLVVDMETAASTQGAQATSRLKDFFQRFASAKSRPISDNEIFEQYLTVRINSFDPSVQQQIKDRLIWLAKQMRKRNQTDFYLEELQKDWLEDQHLQPIVALQRRYQQLGVFGLGCIFGALLNLVINNVFGLSDWTYTIIYALLSALIGGMLVQKDSTTPPFRSQLVICLSQSIFVTIVVASSYLLYILDHSLTWVTWWHNAIVYGPVFGLCTALLYWLRAVGWIANIQQAELSPALPWTFPLLRQVRLRHISNGALAGIIIATGIALSDTLTDGLSHIFDDAPRDFFLFILTISILSFGLARLKINGEIQPVDIDFFSFPRFWRKLTDIQHIVTSMVIGACISLLFLINSGLNSGFIETFRSDQGKNFTYGLEAALIYWLVFGFYVSLSSNIPAKWDWRTFPNKSIKFSGRNSLIFGIVIGCFWWLATILASLNQGVTVAIHTGTTYGLLVGLSGGILFGLVIGGATYIQHYLLRYLLSRTGMVPFHYADMLDKAVDNNKKLLRRIGGAYSFIHPLFRDYLATL